MASNILIYSLVIYEIIVNKRHQYKMTRGLQWHREGVIFRRLGVNHQLLKRINTGG